MIFIVMILEAASSEALNYINVKDKAGSSMTKPNLQ